MSLSVRERARAIATFRFVEVRLMEITAAWVPTTPEMEVKVLFGRHLWDFAQHADALGKRTFELRAPLHYTVAPAQSYCSLLEELSAREETRDRLSIIYGAVLPGLEARYRSYVANTDNLLDEPTVRIIERILQDYSRMRSESEQVWTELTNIRRSDPAMVREWSHREGETANI